MALNDNDDKSKRLPNWKMVETETMLREVNSRKAVLFAAFSSSVSADRKAKAWQAVVDTVAAAGWPTRTVDSVRKRYEKLLSETKMAVLKRNSTGRPPVDWSVCYDIVMDILGKDNPKICAIAGGIDSGKVDAVEVDATLDDSVEAAVSMPPPSPSSSVRMSNVSPSPAKVARLSVAGNVAVASPSAEYMELLKEQHAAKMALTELKKTKLKLQIDLLQQQLNVNNVPKQYYSNL